MDFDSLNITNLGIRELSTSTLRVQDLDLRNVHLQFDSGGAMAFFATLLTLVLLIHAVQACFAIRYYRDTMARRQTKDNVASYNVFHQGE